MRSVFQHLAAAGARRSTLSHLPELTRLVTEVTQFISTPEQESGGKAIGPNFSGFTLR